MDRQAPKTTSASRPLRLLRAIGYWLVVLAVSLALVIGLIMLIESRDPSSIS